MHQRHAAGIKQLVDRQVFKWREEAHAHGESSEVPMGTPQTEKLGPYVAFSRDFGCGALELAQELSLRLGWSLFDRDLMDEIAKEAHLRLSVVESFDERTRSWLAEYIEGLTFMASFSEHDFFRHLVSVVTTVARHGKAILVGRGSCFILPPADGVRVRLIAPFDKRVEWMMPKHHLTKVEAEKLVREKDQDRAQFIQRHFHRPVDDASAYDRLFNTAECSREAILHGILELLRTKLGIRVPVDAPGVPLVL